MKRKILLVVLLACLGVASYTFYTAWRLQDPNFQRERTLGDLRMFEIPDSSREFVEMDAFATKRPAREGTKEIVQMVPLSFEAKILERPERIETGYLYEAFSVIGLEEAPEVHHRMFVETANGTVLPVYVWDSIAESFKEDPAPVKMVGFHIYTYSKGPAIVVDGVI